MNFLQDTLSGPPHYMDSPMLNVMSQHVFVEINNTPKMSWNSIDILLTITTKVGHGHYE